MEFLKSRLQSENRKKIKMPAKDQLLILLLSGSLLVVIAIPTDGGKKKAPPDSGGDPAEELKTATGQEPDSYEKRQEERLKEALEKVEGVGEVEVMITLKSSWEKIVEKDRPSSSQTVEEADAGGGTRQTQEVSRSETTVYREESGERTPYVVKELEPEVEGVIVIARGGGNASVKQNILEAVQALFPVEAHKIKIMKMEGSK